MSCSSHLSSPPFTIHHHSPLFTALHHSSPFTIHHSLLLTPHSSLLIPYSVFLTPYSLLPTPPPSPFTTTIERGGVVRGWMERLRRGEGRGGREGREGRRGVEGEGAGEGEGEGAHLIMHRRADKCHKTSRQNNVLQRGDDALQPFLNTDDAAMLEQHGPSTVPPAASCALRALSCVAQCETHHLPKIVIVRTRLGANSRRACVNIGEGRMLHQFLLVFSCPVRTSLSPFPSSMSCESTNQILVQLNPSRHLT